MRIICRDQHTGVTWFSRVQNATYARQRRIRRATSRANEKNRRGSGSGSIVTCRRRRRRTIPSSHTSAGNRARIICYVIVRRRVLSAVSLHALSCPRSAACARRNAIHSDGRKTEPGGGGGPRPSPSASGAAAARAHARTRLRAPRSRIPPSTGHCGRDCSLPPPSHSTASGGRLPPPCKSTRGVRPTDDFV